MSVRFSRRRLLSAAKALALTGLAQPLSSRLAVGGTSFSADLFSLGVASGDPVADGFVIWTRLAPDPLNGGGMPPEALPVAWEVAEDPRFLKIARRGKSVAAPERAHAVHVDVTGLAPDRWWYYRFIAGGQTSPVGRSRTFPPKGAPADRLRFGFASCQHFAQGYFTAYDAMMEDELDLILHLGDYIYESTWGPKVRFHLPEPKTLEGYRNQHALYKSDAALKAAHAWHPFAVTWDDHEVDNDYAGPHSEENDPVDAFLLRRAAAYRAYYEHMPLRALARPQGASMRLYTTLNFGDLASFALVDTRQHRSDHACQGETEFGGQFVNCEERLETSRTMLGAEQEKWLAQALSRSNARWKVIAQSLMMSEVLIKTPMGDRWSSDSWDGYPAARQRLLNAIVEGRMENVVSIGGDVHSFWANDLKRDFRDAEGPAIATEFVTTSVAADGLPAELVEPLLPFNPHVKFFDSRSRGFTKVEITPQIWTTELRAVDTIASPTAVARTLKTFVVEAGRPGATPA